MPVGMVLSGLVVRIGETAMPRENALILPFYLAAFASLLLGVVGWKALARGFENTYRISDAPCLPSPAPTDRVRASL